MLNANASKWFPECGDQDKGVVTKLSSQAAAFVPTGMFNMQLLEAEAEAEAVSESDSSETATVKQLSFLAPVYVPPKKQLSVVAPEYVPKLAPCVFYGKGACKHGSSCLFLHGAREEKFDGRTISDAGELDKLTICVEGTTECTFGKGGTVTLVNTSSSANIVRVCINGICQSITDEDISRALSSFGPPGCLARIVRKHESYAFVTFAESSQASYAVAELHGSNYERWGCLNAQGLVSVRLAAEAGSVTMGATNVKLSWYASDGPTFDHSPKPLQPPTSATSKDSKDASSRQKSRPRLAISASLFPS